DSIVSAIAVATERTSHTPDFVTAVTYEGEEWTFFAAGAMRQLHRTQTNATEAGLAATIGASYEGEVFGATSRFAMQASVAQNMPAYLGTTFDRETIRSVIGGGGDIRGWSAVASIGRDLSDEWSANAYVSMLDVEFPALLLAGTGRVVSTRAAANLIY